MTVWRSSVALLIVAVGLAVATPASGQDEVRCGWSIATIVGTAGPDRLVGSSGDDVIAGLGGNDVIVGGGGDDIICGGDGNDRIRAGRGSDQVFGNSGRDRLFGGAGRDSVNGGPGRDFVRGDAGSDVLNGGVGRDRCVGRSGLDIADGSCEAHSAESIVRVLNRGGAKVYGAVPGSDLPHEASVIAIPASIMDDGSGPRLCVGEWYGSDEAAVCPGLLVPELTTKWANPFRGAVFGSRLLVADWPPVGGELTLQSDREPWISFPGQLRPEVVATELPVECAGLTVDTALGIPALSSWSRRNFGMSGGIRIAYPDSVLNPRPARGVRVLQVKGTEEEVEAVRAELSTATKTACVVQVGYTLSELRTTRIQVARSGVLFDHLEQQNPMVHVEVLVADGATVDALVEAVDRPDLLRIIGVAAILE